MAKLNVIFYVISVLTAFYLGAVVRPLGATGACVSSGRKGAFMKQLGIKAESTVSKLHIYCSGDKNLALELPGIYKRFTFYF